MNCSDFVLAFLFAKLIVYREIVSLLKFLIGVSGKIGGLLKCRQIWCFLVKSIELS